MIIIMTMKMSAIMITGDNSMIRMMIMTMISTRVEMAKSEERESELAQRTECFV